MAYIADELRKKEEEQAALSEQKIQVHRRLQYAISLASGNESDLEKLDKELRDLPDNLRLLRGDGINQTQIWQEVIKILSYTIF